MKHPLKCKECNDFRYLKIFGVRWEKDKKSVGIKVPFFICPSCGSREPLYEKEYYDKLAEEEYSKLKEGEFTSIEFKYEQKEFSRFSHLEFKYSSEDYYLIPGLYREFDEGYLCPVFFDKDILLYYNNHPDYSVKLYSFSSGNIYFKGEALFRWGFGINRNGKIFKWLGDLNEDFEDEEMKSHLKRFQASNIESDHDIYSTFYLSQNPFSPEDAFQESDNETKIFSLKEKLDNVFFSLFGFKLTKIEIDDLFEYYKPPILEEKEQIFNAYISLSKLIIENIQIDLLKSKLIENESLKKEEIKKLGSIKTFQNFCKQILNIENIDEIISPIYVLSDLRQLQGHLADKSFEDKYNFCKERLGLEKDANHFQVYEKLILELVKFYKVLIDNINASR